jgi:predicted AAA+ superfamily ATPase
VLRGSAARKLRQTGADLLPGRSLHHRLYPLTLTERPPKPEETNSADSPRAFSWADRKGVAKPLPFTDLRTRLAFGELPGVVTAQVGHRAELLRFYTVLHVDEDVRREAMVRDWLERNGKHVPIESSGRSDQT